MRRSLRRFSPAHSSPHQDLDLARPSEALSLRSCHISRVSTSRIQSHSQRQEETWRSTHGICSAVSTLHRMRPLDSRRDTCLSLDCILRLVSKLTSILTTSIKNLRISRTICTPHMLTLGTITPTAVEHNLRFMGFQTLAACASHSLPDFFID